MLKLLIAIFTLFSSTLADDVLSNCANGGTSCPTGGASHRLLEEEKVLVKQSSQILVSGTRSVRDSDSVDFMPLFEDMKDSQWVAFAHPVVTPDQRVIPAVQAQEAGGKLQLKVSEFCSGTAGEAYVSWMMWRVGHYASNSPNATATIEVNLMKVKYEAGVANFNIQFKEPHAVAPFVFAQIQSTVGKAPSVHVTEVALNNAKGIVRSQDVTLTNELSLGYVVVPPQNFNVSDHIVLSPSQEVTVDSGAFTSKLQKTFSCGSSVMMCPVDEPASTKLHVSYIHSHQVTTGASVAVTCAGNTPTFTGAAATKVNFLALTSDLYCSAWKLFDLDLRDFNQHMPDANAAADEKKQAPIVLIGLILGGIVGVLLLAAGLYFLCRPASIHGQKTNQDPMQGGVAPQQYGAGAAGLPPTPWNVPQKQPFG